MSVPRIDSPSSREPVCVRSACWWKRIASEYGSSPEAQPALQTLGAESRSHNRGPPDFSIASQVSQLRKNLVTLTVKYRINRSHSRWSASRFPAQQHLLAARFAPI